MLMCYRVSVGEMGMVDQIFIPQAEPQQNQVNQSELSLQIATTNHRPRESEESLDWREQTQITSLFRDAAEVEETPVKETLHNAFQG